MIEITRVLCPIDFSDFSQHALAQAVVIARWYDATLTVLHAYAAGPPPVLFSSYAGLVPEPIPPPPAHWKQPTPMLLSYLQASEEDALARLRAAVPKEARTWCHPEELLTTGKAYREILRVARERDVHLIVIGIHGRNPLDLMLLGSTTNQVVRAATCPVLTLRS